nr:hypothetical protein [Marinoscillum sp. MHG1-6]
MESYIVFLMTADLRVMAYAMKPATLRTILMITSTLNASGVAKSNAYLITTYPQFQFRGIRSGILN